MRRADPAQGQRGVAIISVLLTVALATIIVSGLFMREHITVRSVQNRIDLTQARWIERAAIDWSKVILAADKKSTNETHLGEPWAVPVLDTRLDETVTAGAKIDEDARAATLSGQMIDAQSRFNLNSLVVTDTQGGVGVSIANLAVFKRLLSYLDQPESLADVVAARILAAQPTPTTEDSDEPVAVLPMIRVSDLLALPGVDEETVEILSDYVIFLPRQDTAININTASAEVLAAAVKELDLPGARRLVTDRERVYFKDLADFNTKVGSNPQSEENAQLSLDSDWFLVRGLIRFGRVESLTETLLRREPSKVEVIWQRRL